MRKFLVKSLFYIGFIVLSLLLIEYSFFKETVNPFSLKNNILKKKEKDIEVLILGNSHTYYSLNPKYFSNPTINLANKARKIETDYYLLKKNIDNLAQLKSIIIPVSFYTLFAKELSKSEKRLYYNFYDLDSYKQNVITNFLMFNESNKNLLGDLIIGQNKYSDITSLGFRGFDKSFNEKSNDIKERLDKISPNLDINNDVKIDRNLDYLHKISKLCTKRGVDLWIFIPPYHNLFLEEIQSYYDKTNLLLSKAEEKYNFKLINPNKLFLLNDVHFKDGDHLNTFGARFLSKKIDSIVNKYNAVSNLN